MQPHNAEPLQKGPTLAQQAFGRIIDLAAEGIIPIGEPVATQEIADILGVSRSPVREALLMHATKGIIDFRRNIGAVIKPPTQHDIFSGLETRHLVELGAIRKTDPQCVLARIGLSEVELELGTEHDARTQDETLKIDAQLHEGILAITGFTMFVDMFAKPHGIERRLYHALHPLTDSFKRQIAIRNNSLYAALHTTDYGMKQSALEGDYNTQYQIVLTSEIS